MVGLAVVAGIAGVAVALVSVLPRDALAAHHARRVLAVVDRRCRGADLRGRRLRRRLRAACTCGISSFV